MLGAWLSSFIFDLVAAFASMMPSSPGGVRSAGPFVIGFVVHAVGGLDRVSVWGIVITVVALSTSFRVFAVGLTGRVVFSGIPSRRRLELMLCKIQPACTS